MIGKKVEIFIETRTPGGWIERKWLKGTVTKEWTAQQNLRSPEWGWEANLDNGGIYGIHQAGTNWRVV